MTHMATSRGLAATVAVVVVTGVRGGVDREWDGARLLHQIFFRRDGKTEQGLRRRSSRNCRGVGRA